MFLLAADPGIEGAICAYDVRAGRMDIHDMPTQTVATGRKATRKSIDRAGVYEIIRTYMVFGAEWFFCEQVGGLPGQSAPAAFNFGRGVGYLEMAATISGMRWEPVPAATWKRVMRCPADKDAAISRACELMPEIRDQFVSKGSKALRSGRAEAAMLALYAERVLRANP
ncbi:MAG: hypothetical protein INH13_25815 [Cupriavidus sp.]|nr:hypothetical protein [Cupriavidus sp.]